MNPLLQAAQATLLALQTIDPSAIIAGGFLRDHYYGKPVKDIDYFVSSVATLKQIKQVFPFARQEHYAEFLRYQAAEVVDVIDLGTIEGVPAQVIVLAPGLIPEERARLHDFGFCQVWSRGLPTVFYSGTFVRDNFSDTVTLDHCESYSEFCRSMGRWRRLKQKYPEKTLVIPERFQDFSTQFSVEFPDA